MKHIIIRESDVPIRILKTEQRPIRYCIRVNTGDDGHTTAYCFEHIGGKDMMELEQRAIFDVAVKELNKIYKNYGRFAEEDSVTRLFESYGFYRVE